MAPFSDVQHTTHLQTDDTPTSGSTNLVTSGAIHTTLATKADLSSPTFTGTVNGITGAMVGLGNCDNTSDANKPVSTAQQTALNLKANLASPTFTGTINAPILNASLPTVNDSVTITQPSTAYPIQLKLKTGAAGYGAYHWAIGVNGVNTIRVHNQGSVGVYMTNNSTSWTATSDERVKTNITDLSNCLTKLKQIRAVTYNYQSDDTTQGSRVGFIAQDWEAVQPEVVSVTESMGYTDLKGLSYSETIPVLCGAIQELNAKVEALTTRLTTLEGQ